MSIIQVTHPGYRASRWEPGAAAECRVDYTDADGTPAWVEFSAGDEETAREILRDTYRIEECEHCGEWCEPVLRETAGTPRLRVTICRACVDKDPSEYLEWMEEDSPLAWCSVDVLRAVVNAEAAQRIRDLEACLCDHVRDFPCGHAEPDSCCAGCEAKRLTGRAA